MNKNSNDILIYSKEMRNEVKENLTSLGFVLRGKHNGWVTSNTGRSYLKIKKDDIKFEICVYNPAYYSETHFTPRMKEFCDHLDLWCINASFGYIQPDDLSNTVNKLYHLWNRFMRQDGFNELKEYVEKNVQLDGFDTYEPELTIYKIADQYIKEKGIEDDKLHIPYYVIEAALSMIINSILYEKYGDEDEDEADDYSNS